MRKIAIGFTGDFCPWERMEIAFNSNDWQNKLDEVRPFFLK